MSRVVVPPLMRDLTGGLGVVDADGRTVDEVIAYLERCFPGFAARLCPDGDLAAGWAVIVDGNASPAGLRTRVGLNSEVRFSPTVAGG